MARISKGKRTQKTNKNKPSRKVLLKVFIGISIGLLLLLSGVLSYFLAYKGRSFPNLSVAGIKIAGRSQAEIADLLGKNILTPKQINLYYRGQVFEIKGVDIDLSYDYQRSASNAYAYARSGNIISDSFTRLDLFLRPINLPLSVNYDVEKLSKIISIVSGQVSVDAINPSISKANEKIIVNKGSAGTDLNQEKLISLILNSLSYASEAQIEMPVFSSHLMTFMEILYYETNKRLVCRAGPP